MAESASAAADGLEARAEAEYVLQEALLAVEHAVRVGDARGGRIDVLAAEEAVGRLIDDLGPRVGRDVAAAVHEGRRGALEVRVEVTVGSRSAPASATVRAPVTSDLLWLTEHRAVDPTLLHAPRLTCSWPPGDPRRASACVDGSIDPGNLDGPVHSNEPLPFVDGTALTSSVSTSTPAGPPLVGPVVTSGAFLAEHRHEITLPRDTRTVVADADVTCRFRGPTLIRFDDTAVRVRSPRSVPRTGDGATEDAPIGCGTLDRSALDGFVSVDLPPLAVIEVIRDDAVDCVDHPLGLSMDEDTEREWWCNGGDAFVWGDYRGSRTVIAEDSVQIVWDVEPSVDDATVVGSSTGDTLGLVAGDSIVFRRPVGRPVRRVAPYGRNLPMAGPGIPPFGDHPLDAPTSLPSVWESPRVVAALTAQRGAVTIQNPFRGQRHIGPLSIRGSVVGRFTGVFAWEHRTSTGALLGATGYDVLLEYDPRLVDAPPAGMPMLEGQGIRILELDVG